jgi:hypothetical protein
MFRKRRQPTPHFRLPPPFNPMQAEEHKLLVPGIFPYCAMMQIAAEDTEDDYVWCRGYDVRDNRFVDYPPGIPVAKPFGNRLAGVYEIAEIHPAFLPLQTECSIPVDVPWRVGQNPGVSETTQGHPADLDETVEIMYVDGVAVSWMLIDGGQKFYLGKVITADIIAGDTGTVEKHSHAWTATGVEFTVYNPHDVDLPVGLKVRWGKYPGWTGWIVEPWHFTEC